MSGQAIGQAVENDRQQTADPMDVYAKGHAVKPKTEGQKRYLEAILQTI